MEQKDVYEARRLKCYRELAKLKFFEETLKVLYETSKMNAVKARGTGNVIATQYFEGKADGIEELIAKVRASTKTKPQKKHDIDRDEEIM